MDDEELTGKERVARIVALLMKQKKITGAQLAQHFRCSERTIYRDMRVIADAGLPVLGIAGDGYLWKPAP
jgi:predicted DNA-binding transcriptional regulator YafY